MIIILSMNNTKKKNFIAFFASCVLLVNLINTASALTSATITSAPGADDPVCALPSISQQSFGDLSAGVSTSIDYDYSSAFLDLVNQQNAQIMVKVGSVSEQFKFVYFDTHSIKQTISCAGTTGFTFIKLINNFLFMRKASQPEQFHICQFDLAEVAKSVTSLTTKKIYVNPALAVPLTRFIPYGVMIMTNPTEWMVFIAFDDGTAASVSTYLWSTIDQTDTAITSTIDRTFTQFNGFETVIYNDVDGFALLIQGDPNIYETDLSKLPKPDAGSNVRFYRGLGMINFISVFSNDLLSGSFYFVLMDDTTTVETITGLTETSTTPYQDYFDDVGNLIIISDSQVFWGSIVFGSSPLKAIATTAQISTDGLQSIGFSSTTAIFTYNTKIVYYQLTAMNAIVKLFEYTTQTPMTFSGSDYQKSLSFACFCKIIKKVSCYSSTVNCLLLKKGLERCSNTVSLIP